MTSRERVNKVLNHEIPDYLPNGWGGCETAGLHVLPYNELVAALGLPPRAPRVDTFMFNAVMDEDVLLKMQGDMLMIASPRMCARPLRGTVGWNRHELFGTEIELTDNFSLEHTPSMSYLLNNGVRFAQCPIGGTYYDTIPKGDMFDFEEVPDPADFHPSHDFPDEKLRELEKIARAAYESTEFSLVMGETVTDLQLTPGGMIGWYEALLNEPEITDEYLDKAAEAGIAQIKLIDQAVGKYCSMMCIAHDLGDSRGVTMGAELFRSRYKPFYKKLFDGWHRNTNMKINMHSCGAISEIIPDLVEIGLDVLNPVQISASGMEAETVRALAGDKLVLHGGAFDCIQTPPDTDPEKVYEQVRKNIGILGGNGNFLFAGVHNTAATTPRSHIEAVLRAYSDMRGMYNK